MNPTSKQIARISIAIWLTALLLNTAIGLYIMTDDVKVDILGLALKGIIYGAIFSFPVFMVMWLLFYFLFQKNFTAGNIYIAMLVVGVGLTGISFFLFSEYKKLSATVNIPLAEGALVSATIAIAIQFNAIRKVCFRRDHPGYFTKQDKIPL